MVGNKKSFFYVISRLVHDTGKATVVSQASRAVPAPTHAPPASMLRRERWAAMLSTQASARLHAVQPHKGGRTRAHEKWKSRLPWLAELNIVANLWLALGYSDWGTWDVDGSKNNSETDSVIFNLWIWNPGEVACFKLCIQMPLSLVLKQHLVLNILFFLSQANTCRIFYPPFLNTIPVSLSESLF